MDKLFKAKSYEELEDLIYEYLDHDHRCYQDFKRYYEISDYDYHITFLNDSKRFVEVSFSYFYNLFDHLLINQLIKVKDNEFILQDCDLKLVKEDSVINRLFYLYQIQEPAHIYIEDNDYMNKIYNSLKERISKSKEKSVLQEIDKTIHLKEQTKNNLEDLLIHELNILNNVRLTVLEHLRYDYFKENQIAKIKSKNRKIIVEKPYVLLDEFIRERIGVCKQFSLFYGYLIEKLIQDNILFGNYCLDSNLVYSSEKPPSSHIWVRYKTITGSTFILDQEYILELNSKVENKMTIFYKRPKEFERHIVGLLNAKLMVINKKA
ncbi:MAG: hypothetical protein QW210_01195 [Candidatus Woesearchaeota archaeon]